MSNRYVCVCMRVYIVNFICMHAFSCVYYSCTNIQLESSKLLPVVKNIISWTVCKTSNFAVVCVGARQTEARLGERSWRAGRWNLWNHCPRPLTVRNILAVELWKWGGELTSSLERKDGKLACLPWTHRQSRGRAEAEPWRQGWMLPGPQQWLGARRLLSVCAVSLNPKHQSSSPKVPLFRSLHFCLLSRLHVSCRIWWIKTVTLIRGQL